MQFIELIAGIAMMVAAFAAFYSSLPREGKMARFVGSQWEGYIVVAMIGTFAVGAILAVHGLFA